MANRLTTAGLISGLKAAGEPTRLRLIALLAHGELNVKDLTRVLGQSQPRISRHLKLLTEAGLVERFREGSWVYLRLADGSEPAGLVRAIVDSLDLEDPVLARDRERARAVKRERAAAAQAYFKEHAGEWDFIRGLHVSEEQVEAAMLEALGPGPFRFLADMGTGTGRILELFAARAERAAGFDINRDMLAYARAKLESGGLRNCQVRYGDIFNLGLGDGEADAVVLHQVLHFLDEPAGALREAARVLKPGGRLLVADFAPHELDVLRENYAHRRLGIEPRHMRQWMGELGLTLARERDLKPPPGAGANKLTVLLWLAEKPAGGFASARARADRLEMIE